MVSEHMLWGGMFAIGVLYGLALIAFGGYGCFLGQTIFGAFIAVIGVGTASMCAVLLRDVIRDARRHHA